jgi:farnesyl diphosphate synthase
MVAGQVADLRFAEGHDQAAKISSERLLAMHRQKTGALIRYSAEGVAVLARSSPEQRRQVRKFGETLGLAFQVADDLLDYNPAAAERNGLPAQIGVEKTRDLLIKLSDECRQFLKPFGAKAAALTTLIEKNQSRKI